MIVALHGFTGRPGNWREVTPAMELALSGHGVAVPPGWRFDDEVDRIAALLGDIDEPVHLCGYSMGGRVALSVAARFPVARLTLVGAHPGLADESARAERRQRDEVWCRLLEERGIEAFVRAWEDQPMWRSQADLPPPVRERQRRERLAHDPHQLAAALRALGLGAMPPCELERLRGPVDLIAGALDQTYTDFAHRMAARIPGARVSIISRAGHNVVLERPDAILESEQRRAI